MAYRNTIENGRTAGDYEAVTPHDSTNFTTPCRAVYVGVAGDISAVNLSGNTVVFKNAPVGYHPIQAKRINSTGTTATYMVALY